MNTRLWQAAASFAARAHEGQKRRDGRTPYAAHPFRVALTIRDLFGCDDEACIAGALLHDTIEDTPVDYDDIEEGFGREVADVVAAMTKDMRLPQEEREPAYDAQLASAGWRAKMVKLADTVDNLLDAEGSMRSGIDKCERAIGIAENHPGVELAGAIEATKRVLRIAAGA